MILAIEKALAASFGDNESTQGIPAVTAAAAEIQPEEGFIIVDASQMQLGVAATAFGTVSVRYSSPALPSDATSTYQDQLELVAAFLASTASIAAAWDNDDLDLIGSKLMGSTTLVEENRFVCDFSLTLYVQAV
jgi:hypothetical protein